MFLVVTPAKSPASLTYPYLKFDPFVLSEDGLDFEINANSGDEGRSERVVSVAE